MAKIMANIMKDIPWEAPKDDAPMWRYSKNPIIPRNPIKGVSRVFNSAVVRYQGKFVGVFRGDTNTTIPYLYYGESNDGIHFTFKEEKIVFLKEDGTPYQIEYAYDPRVVQIEDEYYIMWCDGMNGKPTIGLAKTKDFKTYYWIGHTFLPFNRNGVLFPRKVNGEYLMLSRPSDDGHTPFGDIYISRSKDLIYWGKHELVMRAGWEWWCGTKVGAGPAPIETDEGWLLFYHGVTKTCAGMVYSIGAALLDLDNPAKVIKRSTPYIMTPEEDYEITGFVPNVCFPCAALTDSETGRIAVYYGCADTFVGIAFTDVNRIIDFIKRN